MEYLEGATAHINHKDGSQLALDWGLLSPPPTYIICRHPLPLTPHLQEEWGPSASSISVCVWGGGLSGQCGREAEGSMALVTMSVSAHMAQVLGGQQVTTLAQAQDRLNVSTDDMDMGTLVLIRPSSSSACLGCRPPPPHPGGPVCSACNRGTLPIKLNESQAATRACFLEISRPDFSESPLRPVIGEASTWLGEREQVPKTSPLQSYSHSYSQ